jgi:hypothetical protein
MRLRHKSWRTVISLLVALVFAIAATPGSMAMPAAQNHVMSQMADCGAGKAMHCDHMKSGHEMPGKPCKNMAACLGMLNCFGMGFVDFVQPEVQVPSRASAMAFTHQTVTGLTLRPDNPPPIV